MKTQQLDILGKPYKIYAELLEDEALNQFTSSMSLDDVVSEEVSFYKVEK